MSDDSNYFNVDKVAIRKITHCQSGTFLFMAIQLIPYHKKFGWLKRPRKIIMPNFSWDETCKCVSCRYFTWRKNRCQKL